MLFIEEFLDETTLLAEKEEFMLIKLIKGESLIDFTRRFYEKAQFLRCHGHLLLIDAKNAMFQALDPYQSLSLFTAQGIRQAKNIKEIKNAVAVMSRQFNNITDQELYPKKKVFNVSNPVLTFIVDLVWVHCYNCKELGHYSQNCPKPSNCFQRGGSIRLVQDSEHFNEVIIENESNQEEGLENFSVAMTHKES